MDLLASLEALRDADGAGLVDWSAAAAAASVATSRGSLQLDEAERAAYHDAVREARDGVAAVVGQPVTLPDQIEVVDRHHWIERAAVSFERIVDPMMPTLHQPPIAHAANTATAAVTLGVLGRRVVGQYDPALFGDPSDRAMYLVHPNLTHVAGELDVPLETFRRWVIHHEVSHAAEFALAPWLVDHLESNIERAIGAFAERSIDRTALADLTATMTVVEGFAELLMDEAIDADVADLRAKLDARRAGLGPIATLIDWVLGIDAKRRQYQRGKQFFTTIADRRGLEATLAVWADPSSLPTAAEIGAPERWIERMDP